jgi:hypothetical protein
MRAEEQKGNLKKKRRERERIKDRLEGMISKTVGTIVMHLIILQIKNSHESLRVINL